MYQHKSKNQNTNQSNGHFSAQNTSIASNRRPESQKHLNLQKIADHSNVGSLTQLKHMANNRTTTVGSCCPLQKKDSISSLQTGMFSAIAQLSMFSMGDDERLASKDMTSMSDRTEDEFFTKPIPEMDGKDDMLKLAESPITIFMHGTTLRKMGADDFAQLLLQKGFVRKAKNEIVLITCNGAAILKNDGQKLSNTLNSVIHAAIGNVQVNAEGIPIVKIPSKEGKAEAIPTDYKEDLYRLIPKEAEGWKTFRPEIEKLHTEAERRLKENIQITSRIWGESKTEKDQAFALLEKFNTMAFNLEETEASVRTAKEELDQLEQEDLRSLKLASEAEKRAELWAEIDRELEEQPVGDGWGSDLDLSSFDLDSDEEEKTGQLMPISTVQKKKAFNSQGVIQRMLVPVYNATSEAPSDDKKQEEARNATRNSVEGLKKKYNEEPKPMHSISELKDKEVLRFTGHGHATSFEGFDAKTFANVLEINKLPEHASKIEFYSCSLSAKPNGFAGSLLTIMLEKWKNIDIMAANSVLKINSETGDEMVYPIEMSAELERVEKNYDKAISEISNGDLKAYKEEKARYISQKEKLEGQKAELLPKDDWDVKWGRWSDEEDCDEKVNEDAQVPEKDNAAEIERFDMILEVLLAQYQKNASDLKDKITRQYDTAFAVYQEESDAVYKKYEDQATGKLEKVLPVEITEEK